MVASNELHYTYMVETAAMLLELVETIGAELGIRFEFVNIGGGLGIPYRPENDPLNIEAMGEEITALFVDFKAAGLLPALMMESGRFMTGPHGVLVTRAINRKDIYRNYIGVDACMADLMRPALYGAYHHITVLGKEGAHDRESTTWSARSARTTTSSRSTGPSPRSWIGDLAGDPRHRRPRPRHGLQLQRQAAAPGTAARRTARCALIRRAEETPEDYFATLRSTEKTLQL